MATIIIYSPQHPHISLLAVQTFFYSHTAAASTPAAPTTPNPSGNRSAPEPALAVPDAQFPVAVVLTPPSLDADPDADADAVAVGAAVSCPTTNVVA